MIRLAFGGFEGSPEALREALRRGRISPRELPVLLVIDQALAQVPEDLKARSELLPLLAELLLLKLAPERALAPGEEGEAPLVQALLDLSQAMAFLEARLQARSRLRPVLPPPPRKGLPRLSPRVLLEAARPYRRAILALPRDFFSLEEAWDRVRPLLTGRVAFHALPFRDWREKAVGFFALLEGFRLGEVCLYQEGNFAPLEVEPRVAQGRLGA